MKRLNSAIAIFLILITLLLSGCDAKKEMVNLTEDDYKYVDVVYNHISDWDVAVFDSGDNVYCDKISFYNVEDNLVFVVNYPIGGYRIHMYTVMQTDFSVFIQDISDIYVNSIGARTSIGGTDWGEDSFTSDRDMYDAIEEAYFKYLNTDSNYE